MIEVHLYGDLRRYAEETSTGNKAVVQLVTDSHETIGSVLRQIGIDPAEVGHIFLNHQLLDTCCSMAPWLGYQSAEERIPAGESYLDAPVRPGDRLGIFPRKMAMLVV